MLPPLKISWACYQWLEWLWVIPIVCCDSLLPASDLCGFWPFGANLNLICIAPPSVCTSSTTVKNNKYCLFFFFFLQSCKHFQHYSKRCYIIQFNCFLILNLWVAPVNENLLFLGGCCPWFVWGCCIMGRQWSCLSHVPVMVRYLPDSLGGERRAVKVPLGSPTGKVREALLPPWALCPGVRQL